MSAKIKPYFPLICSLTAAVIFGFAILFIKMGMREVDYDPVKFLAFRFSIGFIVLSLLLVSGKQKVNYKNKPTKLIVFCGVLNPLISQVLETASTTYAPVSQIAALTSIIPVFVVLLSIPVNKEFPGKKQILFMSIAICGVIIIQTLGKDLHGGTTTGFILIALTILVLSVQRVFIRKASVYFTSFETIYVSTGMGAVSFSTFSLIKYGIRGELGHFFDVLFIPDFVISILYMGIISCVIAFLCLTYAAGNLPIAISSSVGTLSTVISVSIGIIIFKESFGFTSILGVIMILGGIIGASLSYNASDKDGNRLKRRKINQTK